MENIEHGFLLPDTRNNMIIAFNWPFHPDTVRLRWKINTATWKKLLQRYRASDLMGKYRPVTDGGERGAHKFHDAGGRENTPTSGECWTEKLTNPRGTITRECLLNHQNQCLQMVAKTGRITILVPKQGNNARNAKREDAVERNAAVGNRSRTPGASFVGARSVREM